MQDPVAYYDARWRGFDYANLYSQERCIFILQALLEAGLERPRMCDLGCGAGWLTGILSAFGPTVGVEISPEAVEQARRRYPLAHFICADATRWQPDPNSFDVVVSQEVLEHIPDKSKYLSVARQALRSGGYLVMTTPNLDVLNAIPQKERETVWEIQPIELPVSRSQLTNLLRTAGFEILRTSSVVFGCGRFREHRIVNSHKLNALLAAFGLKQRWQRFLLNHDFGMYLTTVARAI
jgi:SAM-dependent methyltransferase